MHIPVLLKEIIDSISPKGESVLLDATLGNGGHSKALCEHAGESLVLIGIDRDHDALLRAEQTLINLPNKKFLFERQFRFLDEVVSETPYQKVDYIVMDFGLSSPQLDFSGRGFTFKKDEPLKMTMSTDGKGITAYDVVNYWDEQTLATILFGFGEEKFSRRIAKGIVESRIKRPIETTWQLVEVIKSSVPSWYRLGKIHPATKTFQAIRMAVNEELQNIEEALPKGFNLLSQGGKMAVITFHSLEDRIVKNYFKQISDSGLGYLYSKKPIVPTEDEIHKNPRSRSAKLRVIIKN